VLLGHAVLGRNLEQSLDIDRTNVLNVDGTASLVNVVVVAGVALADSVLLLKDKVAEGTIDLELLAPVFAVDKHLVGVDNVELAGTEEAKDIVVVVALGGKDALGLDQILELVQSMLLLRRQVANTAREDFNIGGGHDI